MYYMLRRAYARLLSFSHHQGRSLRCRAAVAFSGALVWLLINILFLLLWGEIGIIVATAMIIAIVIFITTGFWVNLNNLENRHIYDERNIQALIGIYCMLSPKVSLPYFRNAALSADTCLDYIRLIIRNKPEQIIELGSGTSTVIAGYALKLNGKGKVVALEHDEMWARITRDILREHELEGWAEVLIAPLQQIEVEGQIHEWYDLEKLKDIKRIDILMIDGPPDHYGLGKRYPALPLMAGLMSENGCIIVDDCVMPKWKKRVLEWAISNGFIVESRYLNEKDGLLLRRHSDVLCPPLKKGTGCA